MLRYFSRKYLSFEDLTRPEEDELVLTVREKHITRKPLVLGPGIEKFFDDIPTTPELGYRSKMAKAFSGSLLDLNAMNASDEDVDGPWGDGSSFGERSPYQSFSGREALGHSFSEGMISTPPLSPPKTVYQSLLAEVARHTSVSRTMDGDRVMRYSFSSGLPQIVAVWGAHTFLGAHVLSALLEEGFWVRAVVALEKVAEIQELVGLIGDEARIKLYPIPEHKNESNAFERSAYDEILSGCSFVINTLVASLTQAEWIYASASELLNAMTSHVSKPLRRYVFTGSVNCLSCFNEGDENHYERYMDACTPENTDPVQFARIQAEKDASFWGLQNNIDVVTLLPSVMIGPARTRSASESVRMIGNIALGNKKWCLPFAPKVYWNFVDVRDVARMHVNALQCILSPETQKAISRCFIVAHHQDTKYSQLSKAIRHACPVLTPPIYDLPNWITLLVAPLLVSVSRPTIRQFRLTLGKRNVFDVQRAQRELNFSPVPLHQTIQDMLSDLVDLGIIALTPHTQISSRSHRVTSACLSFLSIVTGTLVLGLLFRSRYA